jgi:hypothetical protein
MNCATRYGPSPPLPVEPLRFQPQKDWTGHAPTRG